MRGFFCYGETAKREYVWLECKDCGDRNYRTQVNVQGGTRNWSWSNFANVKRKATVSQDSQEITHLGQ